jgi:hypothetical protein
MSLFTCIDVKGFLTKPICERKHVNHELPNKEDSTILSCVDGYIEPFCNKIPTPIKTKQKCRWWLQKMPDKSYGEAEDLLK